ncbi:pectate lyase-like adhesive domain-containing protein, partial [Lactobacillus johnsonii]|uniref:pectate lyase-like adhesive domain-containing protein n=1 Tax=Lactobacillus johnsonii TaxID=33959 RepID=UPI0035119ED1
MKDKKFKKNQKNKYVDPNSLKESGDSSNPYLKELAALAAILGTGATGAAILPNDRVYAAQTSVDAKSQIVGSVSESTQTDLSKKGNSKSDENGVSTSNSEAKSMSTSSSKSLRISRSASTSLSQSQQISQSMSLSNSQSLSESLSYSKSKLNSSSNTQKKISNSETHSTFKSSKNKKISEENSLTSSSNTNRSSNKTNIRNFYSSETSSLDRSQGPFQSNTSEINSLSLSSRQLIGENFQIPVVIQNSINNSSDNKTQTNNKKLQIDKLNLTGVFTNLLQINDENAVDVSTSAEFQNALNNSTVNAIRLTANIDLGQSSIGSIRIPPRNLTIDGANHDLNLGNNCIWLNNSASPKTTTIIKSLNLYTANNRGGFALTNSGAETLIYDNVHATGGAAVFADTYDTSSANFVGYSTLLYAGNDLIVDDNASLIINNNMSAYDVAMLANNGEHAVRVGENATLRINNTYSYSGGEIWNNVGNIALTNGEAEFTAGKNSNINLSTSGANIYIASGSTNNTVNFEAATNTTFSGNTNFYFGGSDNTVNIDDPAHVILNTTTGTTYSTNSSNLTINATDTNVIVTKNGVTKRSNYFANNRSTVNGTNYTIGITIGEQNNGETAVKNVMADINKSGTTRVEYTSETQHSESISDSIRTSESISTAIIESESTSASERESESLSNSVSMSESLSNSVSMSESLSNSVSMSE